MTFVARVFELTRLSVRGMEKVSSTNEGRQLAQSQGVVLECESYLLVEAWYGCDNLLVYLVLRLLLFGESVEYMRENGQYMQAKMGYIPSMEIGR